VKHAWLLCLLAAASACAASDRHTDVPDIAQQGALVVGHTARGNQVLLGERPLRVGTDGAFAFGVARDEAGPLKLTVRWFDGATETVNIRISGRDWPIENIHGVPPTTVNPPPEIAARIAREQAAVSAARLLDDARDDYEESFHWPVHGRISGRFGNQRVYVLDDGTAVPKSPHSGMDIAAKTGTPVLAPASGVVSFVAPALYLTGGTVVLDHGHGVSSNFLHLSRIDVHVGDRVRQDQAIGAVGATGRASGPHLHWGMSWFDVRVDPLLVLESSKHP
jgi:murein DD-endopeptidase MepM/ murein hydrolase activator NlpD